jgi:hypothetical protein
LIQVEVTQAVSAQGVGITEVSTTDVVRAFSFPAARFRRDLRAVTSEIYPVLREMPGLPWTEDAAALGLYAHTERLFNSINQTAS